jgi:hypothetical protein
MATNANPELVPNRGDTQTDLLWKLNLAFGSVDWETITQRLIQIDANTDELEPKVDQIIIEAVDINMNTDELETVLGLVGGTWGATQQDHTVDASILSFIRGLVKHEITDKVLQQSVAGTLSVIGTELAVALANKRIKNHVFTFDVLNIDDDVTVGIYGKANGEATFARAGEQDALITANGRYMLKVKDTPLSDVALRLVDENGGTAVTIENIEYLGTE